MEEIVLALRFDIFISMIWIAGKWLLRKDLQWESVTPSRAMIVQHR
jgi:hypothetical protein